VSRPLLISFHDTHDITLPLRNMSASSSFPVRVTPAIGRICLYIAVHHEAERNPFLETDSNKQRVHIRKTGMKLGVSLREKK
jgi:hypothetical protein